MNKKLLIPILIFVICWNTVLISFNDAYNTAECHAELLKSEKITETEKIEELLTVFNHTDGENQYMTWNEYILCVLSAEMPVSYGLEALKAQAVAARTYTLYCINNKKEKKNGADICTDYKHCQAFRSSEDVMNSFSEEEYSVLLRAVNETEGEILEYDGEVINAVYHASSDGKTEDAVNVWEADVPYLVSVISYGEESMPGFESEVIISEDGFLEKLKLYGYDTDGFENFRIMTHYNNNNRASYVEIVSDANDVIDIPATGLRSIFALRSCSFVLNKENGNIKFLVKGYGHGVGMSQYGAKIMAENGRDYKDILLHYYTGCSIKTRKF